jgi:hypothetical protein
MREAERQINTSIQKMQGNLRIAGGAFLAVGAAGIKVTSDARQMNAALGQTALTVGVSTKAMRDLALATTDVTFPLDSVIKTFDLLARAGIKDTDMMQKAARAFDALGDATSSSGDAMADLLLPAFKLFGERIPTTSAELDKFTWLTKNTLVDLSDFGTLLTRMAPHMDELNMSMEDAIATLAALSEHGITGSAATLALRTAITQTASSGEDLNTILGITQTEIDGFKQKMDDAVGITDEYAKEASKQFGIMAKLKQKFSELALVTGTLLEPLEPILALMTALGLAMIFLSTATGAHVAAMVAQRFAFVVLHPLMAAQIAITKIATAVQWAWNAALSANPIGLIILAVAGLVAGIVALVRHWHGVVDFFRGPATVAMEQLQGKIKDLGNEILTTIDKAKTASLKQWADDQKKSIGEVINALQAGKVQQYQPFSEETLAAIEKVNLELAAQLRTLQGQIGETTTEFGKLDKELTAERILDIQTKLIDPATTKEEAASLYQELGELYAKQWAQAVEDHKSDIITALNNMKLEVDRSLADQLASWQKHWNDINAGNDGTVIYLRDVVLPAMNQALIDGFITQEVVNEWRKRYDEALTKLGTLQGQKTVGMEMGGVVIGGVTRPEEWTLSTDWLKNIPSKQYGGIVPGPIGEPTLVMAHGGELFSGIYPGLENMGRSVDNREIHQHFHVGTLIADEIGLREFMRRIKQLSGEDGRRNTFAQVNQGYFYGKSSI